MSVYSQHLLWKKVHFHAYKHNKQAQPSPIFLCVRDTFIEKYSLFRQWSGMAPGFSPKGTKRAKTKHTQMALDPA